MEEARLGEQDTRGKGFINKQNNIHKQMVDK